jgi:hypothetical protein
MFIKNLTMDNKECDYYDNYREFTLGESEEWEKEVYGDWENEYKKMQEKIENLSTVERYNIINKPIQAYCGDGYKRMNSFLRDGGEITNEYDMRSKMLCDNLRKCQMTAPAIPEDIIVYRSISKEIFVKIIEICTENGDFVENGFMSACLTSDIAKDEDFENNNLFKLYLPKGTRAVMPNLIIDRGENEIIIQNGAKLKMCKKPYIDRKIQKRICEMEVSL